MKSFTQKNGQSLAAPLLFVSYQQSTLQIFARDFQEIQKNQFLKPRITFPSKYFTCIRREETLNKLQKSLQKRQVVVVLNDPSVPLKRIGKTEIAIQYFEEHQKDYTYAFWIQAFDPWYFQQDIRRMADYLKISIEKIREWLSDNTSYLIVFDGIEDHQLIKRYLPSTPKGHIIITSRAPFFTDNPLKIGLFSPKEGITFLCANAKGSQNDAQRVAQSLGHVPSSLYRAVETMEAEGISLSNYLTHCQTVLESHAEMANTISNLPPRNRDFVGREPGLVALEESFSKNKPVVLAANIGLGGIGKTQIALQYAFRTCPNYNFIWWINCGNIQTSYDNLAKRLKVSLTEEEKKQENALFKKVNNYLEKTPGWLLIFDDAEDEKSLDGLLPESGGHILISSRSSTWDTTQKEVFRIDVFQREESIDLILKVTNLYGHEEEADKLAEELKDLPLAVAQAAAYIRETKIPIRDYVESFQKVHEALWKRENPTNNYASTVKVTWNISMEKIQALEEQEAIVPQPVAMPLMQLCSFLAPNDIPKKILLLEWLKIKYSENQRNINTCLDDLDRTFKLLERFSMIGANETYISVHALVQTVVKDQLPLKKQQELYEQAFKIVALCMKFNGNDVSTWDKPKVCIPHGTALLQEKKLIESILPHTKFELVHALETIHSIFENFHKALEYSKDCVILADKFLDSIHVMNANDNDESIKNDIITSLTDYNYIPIANVCYNRISANYIALGNFKEALRWQKILKTRLKFFNFISDASNYNIIGGIYRNLGDPDKALKKHQKALAIILERPKENDPELATSYNNIGLIYQILGNSQEALAYLQKAFKMSQKICGKNHPSLAVCLNSMGTAYLGLECIKEAIECHEKALKIQIKIFGKDHQAVALTYSNIAAIAITYSDIDQKYPGFGDLHIALDYSQKALKIYLEALIENNPHLVTIYNNIGEANRQLGNFDEALKNHRMSLKIGLQLFGEKHPDVARSHNNIALVHKDLRNFSTALDCFLKALKILREIFGENHPNIATTYKSIGELYRNLGNFNEALKYYQKSFVILYNTYSQPYSSLLDGLNELIDVARQVHPSQLGTLETIYPLSFELSGSKSKVMTRELSLLVSVEEIGLNFGFRIPCLQIDGNCFIYDLYKENVKIETCESPQDNSFTKTFAHLHSFRPPHAKENAYYYKASIWDPENNLNVLLKILRESGPMIIGGGFGKHCYEEPPIKVNQFNKTILGWRKNATRVQNPQLHFIIVVGAAKAGSSTIPEEYIYFIDPSDSSNLDHPANNVLYKISYQNLKNHIKICEPMKAYAIQL